MGLQASAAGLESTKNRTALKKIYKKIIVIEKTSSQHLSFPGGVWVRGEMSVGKPWSKASLRCFCPRLSHTLFAQRKHSRLIHTETGSNKPDVVTVLVSQQIGEQPTLGVRGMASPQHPLPKVDC